LSDTSHHICLRVSDEAAVRAFLPVAIAGGCADDCEPGQRQGAMTGYCGAFIRDGEGNKIQASTFRPRSAPRMASATQQLSLPPVAVIVRRIFSSVGGRQFSSASARVRGKSNVTTAPRTTVLSSASSA
jgi:hypothetical protein